LDFSFLHIQTIESLKKEEPRAGKRKPIEESEDEEDAKKNDAAGPNGASPGSSETTVNAGPISGDSSATVNGGVVV
jgi:Leucine-rich repeat (LRR) protein